MVFYGGLEEASEASLQWSLLGIIYSSIRLYICLISKLQACLVRNKQLLMLKNVQNMLTASCTL